MPGTPLWIFKTLIILSIFLQFKFLSTYKSENDLCQHFKAFQNFKSGIPIYQLFPVRDCWQKSIHIDKQYPAYPPTTMLFLYPLSFLNLPAATIFWDIANITVFILLLTLIMLFFQKLKLSVFSIALFISTFTSTLMLAFYIRNFTIMLTFLIFLSLLIIKKKQFLAGFLVAVAGLLKLWPLIFLSLGLLNKRYRKFFLSGAITFLTGLVISTQIFGLNNFFDYVTKVIPFEHIFSYFPGNLSLTSALVKNNSIFLQILSFILAIYSLVHLFKSAKNPYLFFAVSTIVYFVFGPLSWSTTAILLVIPLIILFQKIISQKKLISPFSLFIITLGSVNFLFPELTIYLSYFFNLSFLTFVLSATPVLVIKPLTD